MSETIYVVASGEYSDYRVLAVFATKEQAERATALSGGDWPTDYRVESLRFFPEGTDAAMLTVYSGSVEMWDNGKAEPPKFSSHTAAEFDQWQAPEANGRVKVRQVRAPVHQNKGGRFECYGTNESAVRKTVSDKRAEHIALGPHRVAEKNVGGA